MAIPEYNETAVANKANIGGIENREGVITGDDVNENFAILMADLKRLYNALRTGSFWYGNDSGAANAYVVTANAEFAPTSYAAGQVFSFRAVAANTGASTVNVNGLGAKALMLNGVALSPGDISANDIVFIMYDGTNFQMLGGARFVALARITTPQGTINLDAKQDEVTFAEGDGITITHSGKTLTFAFAPGADFDLSGTVTMSGTLALMGNLSGGGAISPTGEVNLSGTTLTLPSNHSNGRGPRTSGTNAPSGTPSADEIYYRYD